MEACRALGLAARLCGYQEGDPNQEQRDSMPGRRYICPVLARGYDPTNGSSVADRHVTLVASALPSHAAPVSGKFHEVSSQGMQYHISIQPL